MPGKPSPSAPRICPGGTLPRAQWGDGGLCPRGCTHPPRAGSAPGCPRLRVPEGTLPPRWHPIVTSKHSAPSEPQCPIGKELGISCWGEEGWPWVGGTTRPGGSSAPALHPAPLSSWPGTGARPRTTCTRANPTCRAHRSPCGGRLSGSSVSHRPRGPSLSPGSPCPGTGPVGHPFTSSRPCLRRCGRQEAHPSPPRCCTPGPALPGGCAARQAGWRGPRWVAGFQMGGEAPHRQRGPSHAMSPQGS